MLFKTRTVVIFMLIGMLLGGFLTWTVSDWMETSRFEDADQNGKNGHADSQSGWEQMLESSGMSKQQLQKILRAYQLIGERYYKEVELNKVIDGAIEGMLQSLDDPYSVYMDREEAEKFNSAVIDSTFSGIGAEVTMENGRVTIVAPIKGSPAEKAGLKARDVVISVNGESLEGLSLNEAVMKIRGPKGTQAVLEILREGTATPLEIIVVRDEIDIETLYAKRLEGDIGYIEIRQFALNTVERFLEELNALEEQGIKGLIIDVRNNPGGVLQSVVRMAEPFVPAGEIIVQTEMRHDRSVQVQKEVSRQGNGKPYPVAVLTNGGSASASEILAAAIQEAGGGVVVGESTYGKGLVQMSFDSGVGDGTNIKLTIGRWLTPKGNFIDEVGVKPDIEVQLPEYFMVFPMSKKETLRKGDLSQDVLNLQVMLAGLGHEVDRKDGYFSDRTEEAVKAFQEGHGLPVTGAVDKVTAEKIEEALLEKIMDPRNDTQLQRAIEYVKQAGTSQ